MGSPNPVEDKLLAARFPGTAEGVREQIQVVRDRLAHDPNDSDRAEDVLIVLGEVLNNIVEHAVPDAADPWIEVEIRRDTPGLRVETRDPGRPLPPALLSGASTPSVEGEVSDLPEGGFGWFIIHSLAHDMIYERQEGTNRLMFSLL